MLSVLFSVIVIAVGIAMLVVFLWHAMWTEHQEGRSMTQEPAPIPWEDMGLYIHIGGTGNIVYQSRLDALVPQLDIDRLHTCIEDHLYDDEDGEAIDWDGVRADYERT